MASSGQSLVVSRILEALELAVSGGLSIPLVYNCNIMAQYRPCHKSSLFPSITGPITGEEFQEAVNLARQHGLERLDRLYSPRRMRVLFR